ncbi:MAG: hypothetical protein J7J61_00455 [Candidatus Hydrothermae bacterium]|nr:hypothetical protein [Candidatus Hydrothermae bacterium]
MLVLEEIEIEIEIGIEKKGKGKKRSNKKDPKDRKDPRLSSGVYLAISPPDLTAGLMDMDVVRL